MFSARGEPSLCTLADSCRGLVRLGRMIDFVSSTIFGSVASLGGIADSFQHAPEEGGGAAGGGHHIAAAEQRSIAMTHNELQFRQIPEMRGVVVK